MTELRIVADSSTYGATTPLYRGLAPPTLSRRPKTLILDLDETLVSSYENPNFIDEYKIYSFPEIYHQFHYPSPITYSVSLINHEGTNHIWGLHRPYLHEFLTYIEPYFDNIIVWSAGVEDYVLYITHDIFYNFGHQMPKIIWSRNNCAKTDDDLFHKPIKFVTKAVEVNQYIQIDPQLTLVIDDRGHTFRENPHNGILIPPYRPGKRKNPTLDDLLDRSDIALLQLMKWLESPEVKYATDYRVLDKSKIFTQ